jgi:uncharacterized phage-associated protein
MMLDPTHVSDFLLTESRERGEFLTNLKLQKLLYYADAWSMVLFDEELFAERFQAWVHGPVLVSQYRRFKDFKWRPIDMELPKPRLSARIQNHLEEVIDIFGSETAIALELMTHRERPWLEARGQLPPSETSTAYISKDTTKAFYKAMS